MSKPLSDERLLYLLKSRGAQTPAVLAEALGISATGVRQHLTKLHAQGLVAFDDERHSVGRPKRTWRLSERGHARFPDRHGSLTVELLDATRQVFGEAGMEQLIAHRERQSLEQYRTALKDADSLYQRVQRLAEVRDAEGYMAECGKTDDGYLLIENHCPICAAARECQGLCRSELALFQQVLGEGAAVERVEHLLAGARRCAYRITPR